MIYHHRPKFDILKDFFIFKDSNAWKIYVFFIKWWFFLLNFNFNWFISFKLKIDFGNRKFHTRILFCLVMIYLFYFLSHIDIYFIFCTFFKLIHFLLRVKCIITFICCWRLILFITMTNHSFFLMIFHFFLLIKLIIIFFIVAYVFRLNFKLTESKYWIWLTKFDNGERFLMILLIVQHNS